MVRSLFTKGLSHNAKQSTNWIFTMYSLRTSQNSFVEILQQSWEREAYRGYIHTFMSRVTDR